MAQFYTLEEAARVLGLGPDELKQKAQQREIRAFMDGGTWRFRVADIDELARRRGLGSDPEVSMSELSTRFEGSDLDDPSGSDFDLSEFQLGAAEAGSPPSDPAVDSVAEQDVLLDESSLPSFANTHSTIIGMEPGGLPAGQSDIRPAHAAGGPKDLSDSDVTLSPARPSHSDIQPVGPVGSALSDSDVTLFHEETGSSGDTTPGIQSPVAPEPREPARPRANPVAGSSAEVKATGGLHPEDEQSDFELTASPGGDVFQEEGSDFELTALESDDEFDATPPAPAAKQAGDSDVTGFLPSASGINLARPSDSGINLQSASGFNPNMSGLLSPSTSGLGASGLGAGSGSGSQDLLSSTSLPNPAEKNLFDDTDFEVDVVGTDEVDDGRTVQLDAASDFDLDEGASDEGSEVFAIDEDDVDLNAATTVAPAARSGGGKASSSSGGAKAADWDEEESAAAVALRPRAGSRAADDAALSDEGVPAPAVRLAPAGASSAEWGGAMVGLLGLTAVLVLLSAFVALDLAMNLRANHEGSGFGLVKQLAGMFGK